MRHWLKLSSPPPCLGLVKAASPPVLVDEIAIAGRSAAPPDQKTTFATPLRNDRSKEILPFRLISSPELIEGYHRWLAAIAIRAWT